MDVLVVSVKSAVQTAEIKPLDVNEAVAPERGCRTKDNQNNNKNNQQGRKWRKCLDRYPNLLSTRKVLQNGLKDSSNGSLQMTLLLLVRNELCFCRILGQGATNW